MERAEDLFNTIKEKGAEAIDELIETRKQEELFLDFKRSSDNGSGKRLSDTDRNNFSKAISGFGNSEGGVIVWGVYCSKDKDGADVPHTKIPIDNPTRFAGWLNSVISGCTIPPHQEVKNFPIIAENEKGFVLTYIPKSNHAPHQSVSNKHYYIRAGSDFFPSPHDVLAGMFGRRPQPNVINRFDIEPLIFKDECIQLSVNFSFHNIGFGLASDVFLTAHFWEAIGENCSVDFEYPDDKNINESFVLERFLSLISIPDFRLPPEAFWTPIKFVFTIAPPFQNDLKIDLMFGCSGGRSYSSTILNSADIIKKVYFDCKIMSDIGTLSEKIQFELSKKIFKVR